MSDEERARLLANKLHEQNYAGLTEDLIRAEFKAVRAEALEEWRKGCTLNGTCIDIARARAIK